MTNKEALKILKENTKTRILATDDIEDVDLRILANATAKARLWAQYAYGNGNDYWILYLEECGDFFPQYKECLEKHNDQNSFNRQNSRQSRRFKP